MATKIGANQPCPCESGLKYKRCCGRPDRPPPVKKRTYHVLVGLAAVAVAGFVAASVRISLLPDETPTSQPVTAATGGAPFPEPPGPAPPGQVWRTECGHYHDAPFTLPQPSGSPAPGKVWSEEHQHYH